MIHLLSTLVLIFATTTFGDNLPKSSSGGGRSEMNGYKFSQFSDFAEKWKLVTARYRVDTGEFRLTYADPVAWKVLSAGKTDYPDGAKFAKIGYALGKDPIFTSSLIPKEIQRFQFMIRNAKKHKETDGWGYAIFDYNGKTFTGEDRAASLSCAACHKVAEARGYVFSEIMNTTAGSKLSAKTVSAKLVYETVPTASLPEKLKSMISADHKEVRSLTGELRTHIFLGTLDEIRPALAEEAAKAKLPAVLLGDKKPLFSAVYLDEKNEAQCKEKQVAFIAVQFPPSNLAIGMNVQAEASRGKPGVPSRTPFCYSP